MSAVQITGCSGAGKTTIADAAWRESLRAAGFGDKQVDGISGMAAVTRADFVPEDKRSFMTTTPTTLAAWAQSYLRPALLSTG